MNCPRERLRENPSLGHCQLTLSESADLCAQRPARVFAIAGLHSCVPIALVSNHLPHCRATSANASLIILRSNATKSASTGNISSLVPRCFLLAMYAVIPHKDALLASEVE